MRQSPKFSRHTQKVGEDRFVELFCNNGTHIVFRHTSCPIMSSDTYFSRFENKDQPSESSPTKIVEAFGLGKCPKLVGQICSPDISVRVNALSVICDEFRNPYSVDGCVRAGVIPILAEMIVDPDFTTRVRSSQALHLAAVDATGFAAILERQDTVFPRLLSAAEDPSEDVRNNVYNCLLSTTRTSDGVNANVSFGTTRAFVEAARKDIKPIKPIVLRALHNIVANEEGLQQALDAGAVLAYISLLEKNPDQRNPFEDEIIAEAARSLGYICYDGRAKLPALEGGAVEKLVNVLKIKNLSASLKTSLTLALMAITITNDGKIQVHDFDGLDIIMRLLYDDSRAVVLNALKIISNLAVYPKNREAFLTDSTCAVKIRKLSKSEDKLVAKHATSTLEAVNWNP